MKFKIISSVLLLTISYGAIAFENEGWNEVVKRAIEDRKNNRDVLNYIKYEPVFVPSNLPKNPNAHLMNGNAADPRKILMDIKMSAALHGRTEGIRRATLDAFGEVEADSDKNAAKLAVGDKYQKLFQQLLADFEKMSDVQLVNEAVKVSANAARTDSYGFQDGVKAGAEFAAKSKYVESGTANGKADAEKIVDVKLKERAEKEANERATKEAQANLMKPESLKAVPALEQNTDAEIKSRLFDEPEWENSPYFKPPVRQVNDKDGQTYLDLYKKGFVEAARKAYATVKPTAKAEAIRSLTYWFKNRYAQMDHAAILNDLVTQAKVGFLTSFKTSREEKYRKNYETAYSAFVQNREKEVYTTMLNTAYLNVKDSVLSALAQNLKPGVEATLVDENNDGVFAPGELAFVSLEVNNWGAATQAGEFTAKVADAGGLTLLNQTEALKPLSARSKATLNKVLPFKVPANMAIGTAANMNLEINFKGQVIKTTSLPVTVNYPFEVTSLTVNSQPVPGAAVALGQSFKLRATVVSNKVTKSKDYAGITLSPTLQIKSLDQEGTDSEKATVSFSARVSAAKPSKEVTIQGSRLKMGNFGAKKFRAEIFEGDKLAGFKEFEIGSADPVPVFSKGEFSTLLQNGATSRADVLVVTDNHSFAQKLKDAGSKVNLQVAVLNTRVTSAQDLSEMLGNCSQKIPVVVHGADSADVAKEALNNMCSVLIATYDVELKLKELEGVFTSVDRDFQLSSLNVTPKSFSNQGLVFNEFDYFIGTDKDQKKGRINFASYAQAESPIQNWESALAEFVLVTLPIEKKVEAYVAASASGNQAQFDLISRALQNEILKEIDDNKKWELDEYDPAKMKRTRLFRFIQAYTKLPARDRQQFFRFSELIKDAVGSVFSGMFNARRGHAMDIVQPLTEEAARNGY